MKDYSGCGTKSIAVSCKTCLYSPFLHDPSCSLVPRTTLSPYGTRTRPQLVGPRGLSRMEELAVQDLVNTGASFFQSWSTRTTCRVCGPHTCRQRNSPSSTAVPAVVVSTKTVVLQSLSPVQASFLSSYPASAFREISAKNLVVRIACL